MRNSLLAILKFFFQLLFSSIFLNKATLKIFPKILKVFSEYFLLGQQSVDSFLISVHQCLSIIENLRKNTLCLSEKYFNKIIFKSFILIIVLFDRRVMFLCNRFHISDRGRRLNFKFLLFKSKIKNKVE